MGTYGKKGLALLLCAGLSVSALTGCGKKTEAAPAIFTYNKEAVDNEVATFLFRMQEASFDEIYGNMFAQYYGGANVWDMDLTGQGELYGDTFRKDFQATLEKILVARDHAEDYGITLTDEEEKKISDAADAFLAANSEDTLKSMAASKETVVKALELQTIQKKVEAKVAETADTEVTDEEAAQRKISYICYTPITETEASSEGETEEAAGKTAGQTEAETMTPVAAESETAAIETEASARTKSAGDMESAAESESETETESLEMQAARARYKAMAEEAFDQIRTGEKTFSEIYDDLSGKNERGVMASQITFGQDDTYPAEEIRKATDGLDDDTLVDHIVEANGNYYILHVDLKFDQDATDQKKTEIIDQRKQTAIDDQYTDWEKDVTFDTDAEAYDKLAFDRVYTAPETTGPADTEAATEAAGPTGTEADTEIGIEDATELEITIPVSQTEG